MTFIPDSALASKEAFGHWCKSQWPDHSRQVNGAVHWTGQHGDLIWILDSIIRIVGTGSSKKSCLTEREFVTHLGTSERQAIYRSQGETILATVRRIKGLECANLVMGSTLGVDNRTYDALYLQV